MFSAILPSFLVIFAFFKEKVPVEPSAKGGAFPN